MSASPHAPAHRDASPSASGAYTRIEVILLLSLSREEAIARDASQHDSCAGRADSDDDTRTARSAAVAAVQTLARWHDVQRARAGAIRENAALHEIAQQLGRHRPAARRRWHATVDEILERLNSSTTDRRPIKRYTWMTSEDASLLNSLSPDAARKMENLLLSQARADRHFHDRHRTVPHEDLGRLTGRQASAPWGTGGGRVRRVPPLSES